MIKRTERRNKKTWAALTLMLAACLLTGCSGGSSDPAPTDQTSQTAEASAPAADPAPEPAEDPTAGMTMSQANAYKSAQSYLEYSAFSRTGLIGQLEYEGYSTEDATFAVDACNVDWSEQAAKSAQSYLEYSSFSRQGLIDQLVYEGFTPEQAEYGVSAVGY